MLSFISELSPLQIAAFSIFIGASLASIMLYFNKTVIGSVVRALLKADAKDADSAKTLAEIGLKNNIFVAAALKKHGALRKLVSEVDDKTVYLPDGSSYYTRETPVKIESARFFIREEHRIRAELRYSAKGSDLFMLIISILVFLALSYAVTLFVPFIIDFFGDVTGM